MATNTTVRWANYPCLDCGTRYGYIPEQQKIPARYYGLCSNCLQHHRRAGTLDRYIVARVKPLTVPSAPPTWALPKLRGAAERKCAQQQAIAARVARHESVHEAVVEGDDNTAKRIRNAERFAEAYLQRSAAA